MRILFMTWSIYDARIEKFSKSANGGGMVIRDLCEFCGRQEDTFLFIGAIKLPEITLDNIHIVNTEQYDDVINNSLSHQECRLLTMSYAFEQTLIKLKPDIVSFQGIGELTAYCIKLCLKYNVPYCYTEHLYCGLDFNVNNEEVIKTIAKWVNDIYTIPNINIVTVSTGMKKKILRDYPTLKNQIVVIKNGTDFKPRKIKSTLKNQYNIGSNKVLLCVASIQQRKNQLQIIRAMNLIPENIKQKITILFCGVISKRQDYFTQLQNAIKEYSLENQCIYAGSFSSEKIKEYYSISNGLILPSFAEGLSIAALENIAYGQPVILFKDSECYDDLNDEKIVQVAEERTDKCLADAIIKWYENEWDNEYIVEFSKYFTMERMASEHIEYYQTILKK